MTNDGRKPSKLPSAPATLCFNKDEFMKENFSIDRFVSECRKHVQLETLREDLGLYLRLLRTAMIELINQDYADFVNLSSNLVGLDKAIGKLSVPLGQLKEEVKSVKASVDEAIHQVEAKLSQRQQIRDKKTSLQLLLTSVSCVERIESLLRTQEQFDGSVEIHLDGNLMERIATEYNRLQFVINKSKGLPLIKKLKPRILHITNVLQRNLEDSFLTSLTSKDENGLRQCLRIYATIDKFRDVEDLFRRQVVAPYMEMAVNETVLHSHPQGLKGMYTKILKFIPEQCSQLKLITTTTFGGEPIQGFDFLVNSVWPEIVLDMEIRTPVLCDLTNPKSFHERYLATLEFLEKFEDECESLVVIQRLRKHPSYDIFLNRWNLAVYFQIRFQEIAGLLELSLGDSPKAETNAEKEYFLSQTNTLWACLHRCWAADIFLHSIAHRFWKLSLLLLSRYVQWAVHEFHIEFSKEKINEMDATSSIVVEHPIERPMNGVPLKSTPNQSVVQDLALAVALAHDISKLSQLVPVFVRNVISPILPASSAHKMEVLENCIDEIHEELSHILPKLGDLVVDNLSTQCCSGLKSAYDIPRLFRRTNREVPSKPSTYVTVTIKPLQSFLSDHNTLIPTSCRQEWVLAIITNITVQYLNITSEVLTSIKKMEDSLKRLKKARERSVMAPIGNLTGITDDDKIRLQLALDVEHFCKQVKLLGINSTDIPSLQALVELVEAARSSPGPSS